MDLLVGCWGADVNWVDSEGPNLLGNAVVYESQTVVAGLLRLVGAGLGAVDYGRVGEAGQTVLHILRFAGDVGMMRVFIESGTVDGLDGDLRDVTGMTAGYHFRARENVTDALRETWERLLEVA